MGYVTMKLHYMGKYDLNPESLPSKPHKPNCVRFKEPGNSKKLSIIVSIISIPILVISCIPIFLQGYQEAFKAICIGGYFSLLALFPHEILHALCFKEDVYLYTNWKQGMLFVVGPEDMSKARFIFMSLLPSIISSFIPYLIFVINPNLLIVGAFGAMNMAFGAGDYFNVFNALTQMPKGARTYLHHFNSYWYMP